MKTIFSVALLFALIGCATNSPARIAVLQHPSTKQTVECRVTHIKENMSNRQQVDNCINTYQKAGYRLLSDSADL